jgi:hypothetical protein
VTRDTKRRARTRVRALALTGLLLVLLPGAASPPASETERLAWELQRLYPPSVEPWERWRRHPTVRLPDGREVARDAAYRDDPRFVGAARVLLSSSTPDDGALGAWLLGTAAPSRRASAERALISGLSRDDPRVVFEAVAALGRIGRVTSIDPLARTARAAPWGEVRAAAARSAARIAERAGVEAPSMPVDAAGSLRPLAPDFRRGVSWWVSERGEDAGLSSFRSLAALGVSWVSIHTWDPLQQGLHDPVLASRSHRFGLGDLEALVASAHAAGLAVVFKPHLEMRGYRPSPAERRILRGPDPEARHQLILRIEALRDQGGHNRLSMKSDAAWARWFESYEGYILPYAREARAAGADMFCVGRELDSSAVAREDDWRRLIARIRAEFEGPLVYSANFDSWEKVGFWDALDFIGVSAYFPLSDRPDPSVDALVEGWARSLGPLELASRRWDRPVLLTEAGFPSIPSAPRAPWKEEKVPADVWMQARCYEATLRALADRPWIAGAFFWLWERSSRPAFRDPSHTIVDKPAMFTMARWYTAR